MQLRLAGAVAGLAALIAVAAVAVPRTVFAHDRHGLEDADVRYTVGEARLMSSVPPLRLQITEVRKPPDRPPGPADATLTWRTVFGIPYGTTTLEGQSGTSEWQHGRLLVAWLAFAAVELALAAAAVRLAWTAP